MANQVVEHFIKFFKDESHADQLIKGRLHLERLAYFKRVEENCNDGRADEADATSMWLQPRGIFGTLSVPALKLHTEITEADLAEPIWVGSCAYDHLHLFCLYAVCADGFIDANGRPNYTATNEAAFRLQIAVDERCLKFGSFAVMIYAVPFLNQLKRALSQLNYRSRVGLVRYYDTELFNGEIAESRIPFSKQKRFSLPERV